MLYIPLSCISSPCNLLFLNLAVQLCSTGDRVDATMKGPSEKGDQFAVLEYEMKLDMKGGQMVTHPCAPLPRIEFRHLQVASMCYCSAWCMIARRHGGGGRLLGSGTPAPPPPPSCPPGPLSYQGSIATGHTYGGAKGAEIFFHSPCPRSIPPRPRGRAPNAILEPNLDSNAHPNPQPAPNPTPNPTDDPNQD